MFRQRSMPSTNSCSEMVPLQPTLHIDAVMNIVCGGERVGRSYTVFIKHGPLAKCKQAVGDTRNVLESQLSPL
jgi:hypothetical protein